MDESMRLLLTMAFSAENSASEVIQALANDLQGLGGSAGNAAEALTAMGPAAMALGAGIAGVAAALVEATKAAAEFQTQLSQAQANTTMTTAETQAMGQAILTMSAQSGAGLADLGAGYVHITNLLGDTVDATKVLDVAQQSAISTGGNVADTAETLARVMKEFGLGTDDAATAMDTLHTAAAGDLTLEQFTKNSGNALAQAALYKVPLDQVASAYVTLTKHGMDAADANTQIADQFLRLTTVTPKVATELERVSKLTGVDLVGDFSAAGLASKGLTGIYADLSDAEAKMGMSQEQAAQENMLLGDSLRGGRGLMIDVAYQTNDYLPILGKLDDTTASATKRQDDYNRALATTAGQFNLLKAEAGAAAVVVGGPLNTVLGDLLRAVNTDVKGMGDAASGFGTLLRGAEDLIPGMDHVTASFKVDTAALYDWGQAASEAGAQAAAAMGATGADGLSGAMSSAADVAAGSDQDAAVKAQDAARARAIKDQQAAEKAAYTQSLADAKQFYADQAATAKAAAQATKDVQTAAAQEALDATKAEIAQEKTAYDDRAAQDIKDRQAQTQGALQELAKQNTAANVAAQAAKTAAEVQQAAVQRTADESDTAWKAQVAAIKDASTASENAVHASLDAGLKHGVDTANQLYSAQVAAIDGEVKAREEGDAVIVHDREQASARTIAHIDAEKTAALAAIDAETRAYEAQEAAKVAAIDATSAAQVKALQDRLAAEKQANSERLDVNAMAAKYGAAAGTELSGYFAASDAVEADTQAALAAKAAGNQALADADTAAAAQQAAIAQGLADQLSAINQTVSDQMVTYKIAADSAITADNVAAIQQQATDRKNSLAQQLAAEKQNESDKKASTTAYYDGLKAQEQQALADFKWSMSQNLQAFKDAEDQKKTADKAALDTTLANIALEQTAENTRHAGAIAKIDAKAKADTAAIDLLAQQRKDAATAATAARNADDAAATAQRAAAYADAQQKINSTSQADIAALQAGQQQADTSFTARTAAADAHFKDQQGQITATYDADTAAITAAQTANATALTAMANDTTTYAASANGSLQGVLNTVNQINAAMGRQAQLQQTLQQQSGKGQQFGTGNAGGTGGGRGGPLTTAGPTLGDGHDTALGEAAFQRAAGYVGTNSGTYYRDGDTWCEQFAEDMTGLGNMGTTAANAWGNWGAKRLPGQIYPGPNLLYFSGPTSAGHVMVGDGDNGISVLDPKWGIVEESVGKFLGDNPGASFLGSVPLYGGGTDWHPGGLALVGDRGPELVDLPIGTRVYPNGRGPAGGGDLVININNPTLLNSRDMDELATKLGRVLVRQAGTGYSLAGLGAR